jgi:threonine/homoserine/homoserine lactone efflux protein
MAFLNPKIAVFFLALLGSFVPDTSGLSTRAGVALLALAIDMSWYVAVALILARSGGAAWLAARGRSLDVATGVLLVLAGGAVLVTTILGWGSVP